MAAGKYSKEEPVVTFDNRDISVPRWNSKRGTTHVHHGKLFLDIDRGLVNTGG